MPKKVLFIDRDGTFIKEPENYKLDCLTKLNSIQKHFNYLSKIAKELDFELAMVTNQDGLGTESVFQKKHFGQPKISF
jgi:imidazoleglycerol-phosphate dehydratase / histidinol-phosphatase